ncbi:uncharacterized protein LOC130722156 isoform X2 [Lotus japonicus]|uniref:uncharacterized protein LOC130722156 isoform X2 n=1 Tax=Lotus japonicus TaxID=34305 RepID=UPI0025828C53|nr:uncharacterized protein LOC130722156 isoform X2 [Lotus japonicus]
MSQRKQIRDDRDCPQGQVHSLTGEVAKYKEYTGKSCAQLDTLTTKTNALDETCTSQREQINMLQQQLIAEREKLKNYRNPLSLVNGRKTTVPRSTLYDHLINIWEFNLGLVPGTCNLYFLVDFKFQSPLYSQEIITGSCHTSVVDWYEEDLFGGKKEKG